MLQQDLALARIKLEEAKQRLVRHMCIGSLACHVTEHGLQAHLEEELSARVDLTAT